MNERSATLLQTNQDPALGCELLLNFQDPIDSKLSGNPFGRMGRLFVTGRRAWGEVIYNLGLAHAQSFKRLWPRIDE
jgi:hypothetical protein